MIQILFFFSRIKFTFTELCLGFFYLLRHWSFKLLEKSERKGECLERSCHLGACEKALMQCHKTMETFEGSKETLRHIQRVEKALRRLLATTN
jgi:hypothetical protein